MFDSQSNATIYPDPPNRPASQLSVAAARSISSHVTKVLEEEKRHREKLEKQIQQMKIDEKQKIKKDVEEERDRQSSKYTTANQDAVDEAEKRVKEIAEENKKIKTALEVGKQKQKELFEAAQEKDRLLRQEQKERRENETKLNQKIQEQQTKISNTFSKPSYFSSFQPQLFQSTGPEMFNDCGFTTNQETTSQRQAEPINFKNWTAHNDNSMLTKDSADSNRNTRAISHQCFVSQN